MRKWISFFYSLLFLVSTYGDTRFTEPSKPYIDYFTVEILDKNKQRICNGTMIPGRMVLTTGSCVERIVGADNPDFSKLFVKNAVSNFESDVCFNTPPHYNTSCNDYPIISAKISEDTFDWAVLYLGENHNTNMLPGEVASLTPIESDDSDYIFINNENIHRYAYVIDDDKKSKVYSQLKMSGYGNAGQPRLEFYSDMPLNYLSSTSFSFRDTNKSVLITEREGSPVYSKSCYDSKSLQRDIPRLRGIVGAETTVDVVAHQGLQRALNTPPWSGDSRMIYIQPKSNVTAIENATGEYLKPYINSEEAFKNINREEFVTLGFLGDEAFDGSRVFPTMNARLMPLNKAIKFKWKEKLLFFNSASIRDKNIKKDRINMRPVNDYITSILQFGVGISYYARLRSFGSEVGLFPRRFNRLSRLLRGDNPENVAYLTDTMIEEAFVATALLGLNYRIPRERVGFVIRNPTNRNEIITYRSYDRDALTNPHPGFTPLDENIYELLRTTINNLGVYYYNRVSEIREHEELKAVVRLKYKNLILNPNQGTLNEYDNALSDLFININTNFGLPRTPMRLRYRVDLHGRAFYLFLVFNNTIGFDYRRLQEPLAVRHIRNRLGRNPPGERQEYDCPI